ncbi:MAG: ACP S-malonyltransferase [Planctomycetes bacterium]|nr:ACP S-malonyltransferase [Planctomycetota bacterium]
MTRPRAIVVAPGRGSYTAQEHGALKRHDQRFGFDALVEHELVRAFDDERRRHELPTLGELTTMPFRPGMHLKAPHASSLIFACSLLDFALLRETFDVVAVLGNSLGWYTTLALGEALDPRAAHELILAMARLQDGVRGGQLIYPTSGENWKRDLEAEARVQAAIETTNRDLGSQQAFLSIRLGGWVVLAGTDKGLDALGKHLEPIQRGPRTFPLRLAMHGPFHTPLMEDVSRQASWLLKDLHWNTPRIPMIDGCGRIYSPYSADPDAIRQYTLETQVLETYDFTLSLRVALREFAPDVVLLLGPGNSLGGAAGQILGFEGYRGIRDRATFDGVQARPDRVVYSLGLDEEWQAMEERGR